MPLTVPADVRDNLNAKLEHYRSMAEWYSTHAAQLESAIAALDVIANLDSLPLDPPGSNGSSSKKVLPETLAELSSSKPAPFAAAKSRAKAKNPVAEAPAASEATALPEAEPVEPQKAKAKAKGTGFSLTGSLKAEYKREDRTPDDIISDILEADPTKTYTADDLLNLMYGQRLPKVQRSSARGALSRLLGKGIKENWWQHDSENPAAYQATPAND